MSRARPYPTSAKFWDKIAPKYAKRPVDDPAAYEQKLARVGALLQPEDRVLEIGCGTGTTALRLAPSAASIVATDVSRAMIAIADGKRTAAGIGNVSFRQAEADEPLDEAPFDVIAAFSLLHLVPDMPKVLGAVLAQLKPGGLFLSKTVCLGDGSPWLRLFVRVLRPLGLAPPVTMLRASDLKRAIEEAGFEVVDTDFFGKGRMNPFIVARRPS